MVNFFPLQQSSDGSEKQFATLCFLFIVTRTSLLWFNSAELTDSYLMISWSFRSGDRWHPLYPMLLQTFARIMDPILAGRIISVICGLLTLPVLQRLAKDVYGKRAAMFACLLFFVSPQILWIQTRVLTESLFVLISVATVYSFLRFIKEGGGSHLGLVFFLAGLAVLTRPEGLLLTPLVAVSVISVIKRGSAKQMVTLIPGLVPWILFAVWFHLRSSGANYQTVLADSVESLSSGKCLLYFVSYLEVYPFILTYPVFLLFLLNLGSNSANRIWIFTLIYIHLAWFALLSVHWAWSTRFLIFPSTLLLVEAGAMLAKLESKWRPAIWKATLLFVCLFSLLISAAALYLQRETYADVKDSALFVREHKKNQRVFSDERIKVKYYLGVSVLPYSRDAQYQPGDIVILHSFHTALPDEVVELSRIYKISVVYTANAESIPLLANGLVEKFQNTNNASVLQERFRTQRFQSVVLQILSRK